jgi:ADP-ribose pyrophosphatase
MNRLTRQIRDGCQKSKEVPQEIPLTARRTKPAARSTRKKSPAASHAPGADRGRKSAAVRASAGKSADAKRGGKRRKAARPGKGAAKTALAATGAERARVLSSRIVYQSPLFRITRDSIVEPTGLRTEREIVRHNGSVVILAVDRSSSKKDPWIVIERQYRHAANRFLWEIPAGRLEPGEDPLTGAQRELAEETGYRARKWKTLVEYYASPGFVGESMLVFLAEDLYAGEAAPEEDERIEIRLVRLSEVLRMIEKGAIHDGKTLNAVLLYAWLQGRRRKR